MPQHTAGHLVSIALLSLPNLHGIDEGSAGGKANSNSANRNYVESKADDFDHSEPLAFPENDQSGSNSVGTDIEKEVFKTKLEAESILFKSMNESDAEARQAYSSGLVGEWSSHLPREPEDDSEANFPDSGKQRKDGAGNLVAVAETAKNLALLALFEKMRPADEQIQPPQSGAIAGQQSNISSNYLFPDTFNNGLLSTPLESTDQPSVCRGKHSPENMTSLDEVYVSLIELPFENGDLLVRLCYRREDGRSRLVCRTVRPPRSRRDCSRCLVSLDVSRSGPFLELYRIDQPQKGSELWARLKFSDYESMYMILLSLRLLLRRSPASR